MRTTQQLPRIRNFHLFWNTKDQFVRLAQKYPEILKYEKTYLIPNFLLENNLTTHPFCEIIPASDIGTIELITEIQFYSAYDEKIYCGTDAVAGILTGPL